MRYPILDGLRGFFLIFMMVLHLNQYLHTILGRVNHHALGYVEDAQGFVFISGLVVGLVYGGKLVRKSEEAMRKALWARWRTIYKYHAAVVLILLAAALIAGPAAGPLLKPYLDQPVLFTVASLALLACSHDMGILPLYLYFIAVTPFALTAFHRGQIAPVAAISIIAWLAGQLMIVSLAADAASAVTANLGHPISFQLGFNLLGWQILYMIGLYIGFRLATDPIDLSFLRQPQYEATFYICIGAFLILMIVRQITLYDWLSPEFSEALKQALPRRNMSGLHLFAFLIDLFLLTWLFVSAPYSQSAVMRQIGKFVHWFFTRRFLTMLGQHSLQVFSWHLLVVYGVLWLTDMKRIGEIRGSMMIAIALASLYIPAYLHAAYVRRSKAPKRSSEHAAQVPAE